MTEMKDSGVAWINTIPKKWKLKKIKYALKNRNENNNPIRSKNILSLTVKQGVIPLEEKEGGGNKPKEDYSAYKLAYPNDIVMNSMNVLSGSVGLSKYFGCVSPVYYMLRPIDEKDDVRYYNYIFQTTVFQRSLLGLGNGILMKESDNGKLNTIRMRIPLDKLGNLLIPVPDSSIQRKIADYLDSIIPNIDMLLADIEKQIETLEEYKRSIITEAVTKGLDPDVEMKDSGIEWVGMIPKQWNVTKFKYICSVKTNLVNVKKYQEYPQISPDNIEKDSGILLNYSTVAEAGVISDNHLFFKGQILYSKIRPKLNKATIAPFNGLCSADMYPIETNENTMFVLYMILSQYFLNQVSLVTEDRVKMPKINQEELGVIKIVLPDNINEQEKIVLYLHQKCQDISKAIEEKKEQLETLEQYKKSVIYEYVTGKKEVQ